MSDPFCPESDDLRRDANGPAPTDLLGKLQQNTPVPLSVTLILTQRCNLRCPHCFERKEDISAELSTDELRDLFSQMAQAGTLNLIISGGEPTVRTDFFEVLEAAAAARFSVTLKTSASLLTTADVHRIFDSGVSRMEVSLYSDRPQEHDSFVKLDGAQERALNALQVFQKRKGKASASIACMNWNAHRVGPMMDLCDHIGVRYAVDVRLVLGTAGDTGQKKLQIDETELRRVLSDSRINARELFQQSKPRDFRRSVCGAGVNGVCIRPDGEVWPCGLIPLSMGNVRTTPYAEIVTRSPVAARMAGITWDGNPECVDCRWFRMCSRCPGNALNELGDLNAISPVECMIARLKATTPVSGGSDDESR